MHTILKYIFPFTLLAHVALAQWTEINPLLPRVRYFGIDFVMPDTGWAVGERGVIICTTNGGVKWTQAQSGIQDRLLAVDSYDGRVVITVGNNGSILRSTNAGITWALIPSGRTAEFWNVQMVTDSIGWIVGTQATALKTTNGGLTWQNQQTGFVNIAFWSVHFLNAYYGYVACDNGVVLKTTDGGVQWQTQQAGDFYGLFAIYALDTLHAVTGGFAGKILYTSDGGTVWQKLTHLGTTVNNFAFTDSLHGYLIGDSDFLQTADGGKSWVHVTNFAPHGYAVSFPTSQIGYGVGEKPLDIFKTTNAGASFTKTILNEDFSDVFFANERVGWAMSYGILMKTTDGAQSWLKQNTYPVTMLFLDSLTGFTGTGFSRIDKTTNGGETWTRKLVTGIVDTSSPEGFTAFCFINPALGWAATDRSTFVKTTNGGEDWFVQQNTSFWSINRIQFTDSLYGWAAGHNYEMLVRTTNGGLNWLKSVPPDYKGYYENIQDLYFSNRREGWLLSNRVLYKTDDTGSTWIPVFSGGIDSSTIFGPGFGKMIWLDHSHAFIIGSKVFETQDSGKTWPEVTELMGRGLSSISFPKAGVGYGAGASGMIIKYRDTTLTNVRNLDHRGANIFRLYQNYPNPFNPVTKIKFDISEFSSLVSLKVYDVLGREVRTLFNQELNSGEYEVTVESDKLWRFGASSGVYFYQLALKNKNKIFLETRKMILLR